jgi:hypothetical protein
MHVDHVSNCHRAPILTENEGPAEAGPSLGGQAIAPQIAAAKSSVVR